MKILRVARRLAECHPINIKTSFLSAHALLAEYHSRVDYYITLIYEYLAFSSAQITRVCEAATRLGLPLKLHAAQLSSLGSNILAARFGALSADHLEYTITDDARALAVAGTVAPLLPSACYLLRENQTPVVAHFRQQGLKMALASDSNPGTSQACSLRLMLNMGCTLFRLTPRRCRRASRLSRVCWQGQMGELRTLTDGCPAELVY